jgi:hypothetical protein
MPIGPGKSRVYLTLPDKVLQDLQHEAETSKRTLSEVIVAAVQEGWESATQERAELRRLLTQLAGTVETEFATIQQILSKLVGVVETLTQEVRDSKPAPEPERRIMTYEEMYADDPLYNPPPTADAGPEPTPPPVPERSRWKWPLGR